MTAVLLDQPEVETPAAGWGEAVRVDREPKIGIPAGAKRPQAYLEVGVHINEGGQSRVGVAVASFRPYFLGIDTEAVRREFVRQWLHCEDSRSRSAIPRQLAASWNGALLS